MYQPRRELFQKVALVDLDHEVLTSRMIRKINFYDLSHTVDGIL
jgi:hypothetical protein